MSRTPGSRPIKRIPAVVAVLTVLIALTALALVVPAGAQAASAKRCPTATGGLTQSSLGRLTLGATRATEARRYATTRVSGRGPSSLVHYCLYPSGVSAGYTSRRLLKSIPAGERKSLKGRLVLALTSNPYYALRGVTVHSPVTLGLKQRVRVSRSCQVGRNTWNLFDNGYSSGVLESRGGRVDAIGIANRSLTQRSEQVCSLFRSFRATTKLETVYPRHGTPSSRSSAPGVASAPTAAASPRTAAACVPTGASGVNEYLATLPGATCTVVPGAAGGGSAGLSAGTRHGLLGDGAIGASILSLLAATGSLAPSAANAANATGRGGVASGPSGSRADAAQTGGGRQTTGGGQSADGRQAAGASSLASLFNGNDDDIGWYLGGFMVLTVGGFFVAPWVLSLLRPGV